MKAMSSRIIVAVLWPLCLIAHAHEESSQKTSGELEAFAVPPGYGVDPNYRETYELVSAPFLSGMHWNHFIRVYVQNGATTYKHNQTEFQENFEDSDDWPDETDPQFRTYAPGTVLVKENFWELDGKIGPAHSLTIMVKMEAGYDSEHGDWKYIELDRSGTLRFQGNASKNDVSLRCAQCHASVSDRDYVFAIGAPADVD